MGAVTAIEIDAHCSPSGSLLSTGKGHSYSPGTAPGTWCTPRIGWSNFLFQVSLFLCVKCAKYLMQHMVAVCSGCS